MNGERGKGASKGLESKKSGLLTLRVLNAFSAERRRGTYNSSGIDSRPEKKAIMSIQKKKAPPLPSEQNSLKGPFRGLKKLKRKMEGNLQVSEKRAKRPR